MASEFPIFHLSVVVQSIVALKWPLSAIDRDKTSQVFFILNKLRARRIDLVPAEEGACRRMSTTLCGIHVRDPLQEFLGICQEAHKNSHHDISWSPIPM